MKTLHHRLILYIDGNEAFIFVSADTPRSPSLSIYRNSGEIVLSGAKVTVPPRAVDSGKSIYGILGLITLSLSEYVIVLTGRELQGRLMGHDIYRATEFELLPLNINVSANQPPHPVETHLLALVRSHLYGGSFLFSYEWDVTRRLQAQYDAQGGKAGYMWEMVDDRFFWNRFLQSKLIDSAAVSMNQDLGSFILPVMYGTLDIRSSHIRGRGLQLCVVSRRSRFRAGTRYFRRGIDRDGHVANFNESEQIVLIEDQPSSSAHSDDFFSKLSFVQTRGSVPVFWAEINTLLYKPDLQIMDLQETVDAMRLHLREQFSIYGKQNLVSLLNRTGYEKPIKESYEGYISQVNLPDVKYQHFDFHNECKNMRWDRISLLTDQLRDDLIEQGYFQLDASNSEPTKRQQGTLRTNCMDNLDRTNVVQAFVGKWVFNRQLQSLGILEPNTSIDDYEPLSKDFREIWANHGDSISRAYSGTGALKSDFTRTNERTKAGVMEDGYKSIMRYLKNNYFDGARQDAFDLITGVWKPRNGPSAALFLVTDSRPLLIRSMPYVTSYSLFMIFAGLTLPRTSDYSLFYYNVLWSSLFTLSLVFILIHGIEYVSWPRLVPPKDLIYYDGPGFRSAHHGKGFGSSARGISRRRSASRLHEIELGSLKKRID